MIPSGISVVRHAAPLRICNVRPPAKTAGSLTFPPFSSRLQVVSAVSSSYLCLIFIILRTLGESSADSSLIVEWEGFEALEPIENVTTEEPSGTVKTQTKPEEEPAQAGEVEGPEWKQRRQRLSPAELSESSGDGSGDEYVEEGDRREDAAGNGHRRKVCHRAPLTARMQRSHRNLSQKRANNRRIPTASSSDSEGDGGEEKATATGAHLRRKSVTSTKSRITSTSPPPGRLKRKQSISATGAAAAPTAAKRKRAESTSTTTSATDDPARKYCLGKFTEMFTGIYMQYPHIQQDGKAEEEEESKKVMVERKPEELTEEEKAQVRERATAFAAELEQAAFDTYAESDKHGKLGAGVKYKYVFQPLAHKLLLTTMLSSFTVSIQGALSYSYFQFTAVRSCHVA